MAQQPRQQRIGFYGKFTPTALDTSEADKMRALAGLGQTIADTSLSIACLLYTSPSPRDRQKSRMPSSA